MSDAIKNDYKITQVWLLNLKTAIQVILSVTEISKILPVKANFCLESSITSPLKVYKAPHRMDFCILTLLSRLYFFVEKEYKRWLIAVF